MEAVAFIGIEDDHAFAAQALEHLAHAEKRQRDAQLEQMTVYTAYPEGALVAGGGEEGVDDFQPDQAGAQTKTLEQMANALIAMLFGCVTKRLSATAISGIGGR